MLAYKVVLGIGLRTSGAASVPSVGAAPVPQKTKRLVSLKIALDQVLAEEVVFSSRSKKMH